MLSPQEKRELLAAALFKYSPETDYLRGSVLGNLVKNILHAISPTDEISVEKLLYFFQEHPITSGVPKGKLRERITQLIENGEVSRSRKDDCIYIQLTEKSLQALDNEKQFAEHLLNTIVNRVFVDLITEANRDEISGKFLSLLATIFSTLGASYAESITGIGNTTHNDIVIECKKILAKELDSENGETKFYKRFIGFMRDTNDPEFNILKWNMVSHYYSCRLLGTDGEVDYFSKNALKDSVFFLDTNMILTAINPVAKHHGQFQAISKVFKDLNIKTLISKRTMNEYIAFVSANEIEAKRTFSTIPHDMEGQTQGFFYDLYKELKKDDPSISIEVVFAPFYPADIVMEKDFGTTIRDVSYLDKFIGGERFLEMQTQIYELNKEKRGKKKSQPSLEHDASLILCVEDERKDAETDRIWILTLDTILPEIKVDDGKGGQKSSAICLDALLSNLGPTLSNSKEDQGYFASIFSEAIAQNFFPNSKYFNIHDFEMFVDLNVNTSELPIEVVEEAIDYVSQATGDGLADSGRQGFRNYKLRQYFSTRGSRYANLIKEKEVALEELKLEEQKKHAEKDDKIKQLQSSVITLSEQFQKSEEARQQENIENNKKLSAAEMNYPAASSGVSEQNQLIIGV